MPEYSPPTAKPIASRRTKSPSGASTPTLASLGSRPLSSSATLMIEAEASRAPRRPIRSPKCPKAEVVPLENRPQRAGSLRAQEVD